MHRSDVTEIINACDSGREGELIFRFVYEPVSYTHLDVYKRQPLFFLTKDSAGTTTAALCMVLAMLPMFLLAMYEKNGQPLERCV